GSNPTGGTLSCTNGLSKAAVNGVATFAGCKIDKVGTGYTITATSSGLLGTTSNGFNISAGAPSKLAFTTQPAASDYLSSFPTQPVVTVEDSLGNAATSYAGSVVLSITPGTGPTRAT